MSLLAMSVESQRSSVFTFESAVHSSHVLRGLDDQRRRDTLCDVTVVVEGQSFRAHRSVLASCSEYFTHRVSSHTGQVITLPQERRRDTLCDVTVVVEGQSFRAHRSVLASCSEYFTHRVSSHTGQVITLPQEVTVTGFEPLLKFAYTSKLLFSKDNVIEISSSAAVLGFRDLDNACFDFLLPKFFSSTKGSVPFRKRTCCKKKCKSQSPKADRGVDNDDTLENEKEVKPVSDSPAKREVAWINNKSVSDERGSKSGTPDPDLPPAADARSEGPTDYSVQCPKYRKFQLACGKEACGTEKSLKCPVAVIEDDCYISCLPHTSNCSSRNKPAVDGHGQRFSNPKRPGEGTADQPSQKGADEKETEERKGEIDAIKREADRSEGQWDERRGEMGATRTEEEMELVAAGAGCPDSVPPLTERHSIRGVSTGTNPALPEEPLGLILHHCPLASDEGCSRTGSMGHEELVMEVKDDREAGDSGTGESLSIHLKAEGQDISERRRVDIEMDRDRGRGVETGSVESAVLDEERRTGDRRGSSVERDVAEQLAKGLWLDMSSAPALPKDPDSGLTASDPGTSELKGPSLDWLKHQLILNSRTGACPFLQELDPPRRGTEKDTWESKLSGCEGVSPAGKSPCVSSLNSGEDGDSEDFDTGDMESSSERAEQVQLPFSVEWIVDLSRNDFQQMLKQQSLTHEQLNCVHDMRRRSKNRAAAQRCRKRKLDCIYNLECEINKLRTEREKLVAEKSQLNQMKLTAWHSVSALCQRVCSKANLQPEQLQVLAKYTSQDCPLSSLIPYIDSLLTGPGVPLQPQAPAPLSAGPSGLDVYQASSGPSPSTSSDLVAGNGEHPGDGKVLLDTYQ